VATKIGAVKKLVSAQALYYYTGVLNVIRLWECMWIKVHVFVCMSVLPLLAHWVKYATVTAHNVVESLARSAFSANAKVKKMLWNKKGPGSTKRIWAQAGNL